MLQESTYESAILFASRTAVVTIIIEIPVGCIAGLCVVVDIYKINARRAGPLFQVQDHGGFRHKRAIARKAFDIFITVNELVLLCMLAVLESLRIARHAGKPFSKEKNVHISDWRAR